METNTLTNNVFFRCTTFIHTNPPCVCCLVAWNTHTCTHYRHMTHTHTLYSTYIIQYTEYNAPHLTEEQNNKKRIPTKTDRRWVRTKKKHNNNTALCQRSPKRRADRLKPTHVRRWVAVKQQKRDSRNANEQSKKAHIAQSGYYLML